MTDMKCKKSEDLNYLLLFKKEVITSVNSMILSFTAIRMV